MPVSIARAGLEEREDEAVPARAPRTKQAQTFRIPRELLAFLRSEAQLEERDLTGHVVRLLDGLRTYYGLPRAAAALLDEDRRALGMKRFEYVLHVLFQRSLDVRKAGAGFDAPLGSADDPQR